MPKSKTSPEQGESRIEGKFGWYAIAGAVVVAVVSSTPLAPKLLGIVLRRDFPTLYSALGITVTAVIVASFYFAEDPVAKGPQSLQVPAPLGSKWDATENKDEKTIFDDQDSSWIPPVRVSLDPSDAAYPLILSPEEMQQVAKLVLPIRISSYARWKRLYSLARDGDSFRTFLHFIRQAKCTLLVIRTSRNEVLGAFADTNLQIEGKAEFRGGPDTCLYKVVHGKVIVYRWTAGNRYFHLCDIRNKRLAFGLDEDEGTFGLSVDHDFSVGTTNRCKTFDNDPLCEQERFDVVDLEIYSFLLGQL